ncbi:hypothetical protein FACS1894152_5010 [Bacilli bacterium]|nr:hypothetical protein FACS1894152_5010 [Bacilli bacterium]
MLGVFKEGGDWRAHRELVFVVVVAVEPFWFDSFMFPTDCVALRYDDKFVAICWPDGCGTGDEDDTFFTVCPDTGTPFLVSEFVGAENVDCFAFGFAFAFGVGDNPACSGEEVEGVGSCEELALVVEIEESVGDDNFVNCGRLLSVG